MAVKSNKKVQAKEQNKSEDTSKQNGRATTSGDKTQSKPASVGPKQAALNEALASTAGNVTANVATDALMDAVPAKLVQQYANRADQQYNGWDGYNLPKNFVNSDDGFPDYKNMRSERAERQYGSPRETIAPGSIDVNRDTVYRVGADDPYGYYSQSQLNNNMSGTDANAIYQATHDQRNRWGYGADYYGPELYDSYMNENRREYNNRLRSEGYLPNTSRQLSMPVWGDGAYVAGADAWTNPIYDDLLPVGVGSAHGIPYEYLDAQGQLQRELIDEVEARRKQIYGY